MRTNLEKLAFSCIAIALPKIVSEPKRQYCLCEKICLCAVIPYFSPNITSLINNEGMKYDVSRNINRKYIYRIDNRPTSSVGHNVVLNYFVNHSESE